MTEEEFNSLRPDTVLQLNKPVPNTRPNWVLNMDPLDGITFSKSQGYRPRYAEEYIKIRLPNVRDWLYSVEWLSIHSSSYIQDTEIIL